MLGCIMGLTIGYQIVMRAQNFPSGLVDAIALVKRSRAMAQRLKWRGRVHAVGPIHSEPAALELRPILKRWLDPERGWRRKPIFPSEGWLFSVDVGQGCEPLELGLCRYPYTGPWLGSRRWKRFHSPENAVWRLEGFCKTQYASRQGWDHFRRCHLTVIELLAFWRTFDAKVAIHDEGGYWPRGSERVLRRTLAEYDQSIAAIGGALTDAVGESGRKNIQAPVFAHPQFEHLEAAGMANHGGKISQIVRAVDRVIGASRRT